MLACWKRQFTPKAMEKVRSRDADAEAIAPTLLNLQLPCFLEDVPEDFCSGSGIGGLSGNFEGVAEFESSLPQCEDLDVNGCWEEALLLVEDPKEGASADLDLEIECNQGVTVGHCSLPKVLKNDIRRYFASMFMNTINSAEMKKIESYFRTFMIGPCKFVAEHQALPELGLPDKVVTAGPRLMSHYALGCFVQYPDMVLCLKNSSIITSTGWAGTKIVMQLEVKGTRIHDLDFDDWVPQMVHLGELYRRALGLRSAPSVQVKKRRMVAATGTSSTVKPSTNGVSLSAAEIGAHIGAFCEDVNAPARYERSEEARSETRDVEPATAVDDFTKVRRESSTNQAKRGRIPKSRRSRVVHVDDDDMEIPEAYVRSLFSKARVLPKPVDMLLGGTITLFLDESNHIQHMTLDMSQLNRKPCH